MPVRNYFSETMKILGCLLPLQIFYHVTSGGRQAILVNWNKKCLFIILHSLNQYYLKFNTNFKGYSKYIQQI